MKRIRIALIGFGNAGKAFVKILIDKRHEIENNLGCYFDIVAIVTHSKGSLYDAAGIEITKALDDLERHGYFDKNSKAYCTWNTMEIIQNCDYDVMIEITPLNIFTGQPAIDHISLALGRKKHVITANKGPIAWAYNDLKKQAAEQNVAFFYETTVMDGTPVFNLVDETLPFCKVEAVSGILNTTTNYVLEEMAKGKTFDDAISEGRKRGFVEADPSLDIEGWDAAAKLTALMNVLMNIDIKPTDINRQGIENITHEDIKEARNDDKVIKLVCRGWREENQVYGEVKPVKLDQNHEFSVVKGTSSVVSIKTDLMGTITVVEHDPEIEQTGFGIFSDLVRLVKWEKLNLD